ncbi:hypothetical protein PF006_g20770 [Phytophthora fragariae]|uniref:Uncharacterized protein n=1 Tax=Phytophthora fragariae TaxID=53985 RepID=A0A6A3S311_9STRA|nr:hypothetical protein PF006_g20770 [Phytophthora fragariae]
MVVLLHQHLDMVVTRPWASAGTTESVVVLLKQHLAATQLLASAVPTNPHLDMVVTRPWASAGTTESVVVLLKQHLAATQLLASAVPTNPVLAPLKLR